MTELVLEPQPETVDSLVMQTADADLCTTTAIRGGASISRCVLV